jgi:hypothetical protein
MVCELEFPTTTFEKLTLAGTTEICAAFTERVAAPLVTLPTVLLTTTVNSAPLSEVVVAGVV